MENLPDTSTTVAVVCTIALLAVAYTYTTASASSSAAAAASSAKNTTNTKNEETKTKKKNKKKNKTVKKVENEDEEEEEEEQEREGRRGNKKYTNTTQKNVQDGEENEEEEKESPRKSIAGGLGKQNFFAALSNMETTEDGGLKKKKKNTTEKKQKVKENEAPVKSQNKGSPAPPLPAPKRSPERSPQQQAAELPLPSGPITKSVAANGLLMPSIHSGLPAPASDRATAHKSSESEASEKKKRQSKQAMSMPTGLTNEHAKAEYSAAPIYTEPKEEEAWVTVGTKAKGRSDDSTGSESDSTPSHATSEMTKKQRENKRKADKLREAKSSFSAEQDARGTRHLRTVEAQRVANFKVPNQWSGKGAFDILAAGNDE